MKIKSFVAAAAISISSLGAQAQTFTTKPVEVIASFSDVLLGSVNVPALAGVGGGLGYTLSFTFFGADYSLPAVTFTGIKLGTATTTLGTNGTFSFTNLVQGLYVLKATGAVVGGGTNWIAAQYTISPVPEPETFAMLLAGLGLIGSIARRRTKAAA